MNCRLGAAVSVLLLSVGVASAVEIDESSWYRLTNQNLGTSDALESSSPGGWVGMYENTGTPGQNWRFTKRSGYYQISSQWTGRSFGLDASDASRLTMAAFEQGEAQLWEVKEVSPGWVRLVNRKLGSGKSVEGAARWAGSRMQTTSTQIGQFWKLEKVGPVAPSGGVPLVNAGSEGPNNWDSYVEPIGEVKVRVHFVNFCTPPPPGSPPPVLVAPGDPQPKAYCVGNPEEDGTAEDITNAMNINAGKVEELYREQSYGRVTMKLLWDDKWSTLPGTVDHYNTEGDSWLYREFIHDTAALGPRDGVIVVGFPSSRTRFKPGAGAHAASLGIVKRGINMARGSYADHHTTLAHEIGHTLGLTDLYPGPPGRPFPHMVGPWDLMGDVQYATGFIGWHRHKFGWLDAERSVYLKKGRWLETIAPWSSKYGNSMVVIPSDDTDRPDKVFVIEVAQEVKNRAGEVLSREGAGVLIYAVEQSNPSSRLPLNIIPMMPVGGDGRGEGACVGEYEKSPNSTCQLIAKAPYHVGDTYEDPDSRVKVSVQAELGDGAYNLLIEVH